MFSLLRAPQEAKVVHIDVVQKRNTPKLNEWEGRTFSAFVNDILTWCMGDVLRTANDVVAAAAPGEKHGFDLI